MALPPDLLTLPALAPPPGVKPNFTNPKNLRAPWLAILQLGLTTAAVGMRMYTKKVIVKRMLSEDYWLLAAYIAFIGFHVLVFMNEALPLGVHIWDLTIEGAMQHAKLFHLTTALYAPVALPLKLALILQIKRIVLPHPSLSHDSFYLHLTITLFILLNAVFYTTLFVFQWVTCMPLRKAWDPRITWGYCVPHRLIFHIASAGINALSDVVIVALPQRVLWGLSMGRGKRVGLCGVFGLGGLACICAVLRLFYTIRLYSSTDTTFVGAQVGKLIEPELTFGFLAACLPVLPVFVKHVSNGSCRLWTSQTVPSQTRHSPTMLGSTRLGNIYNRPRQDGGIRKEVKTEIEFSQVDVSEVRAEEWRRETWAEEVGTESSRRSGLEAPRVWS